MKLIITTFFIIFLIQMIVISKLVYALYNKDEQQEELHTIVKKILMDSAKEKEVNNDTAI